MILTPVQPERLLEVLERFRASLNDAFAHRVFDAIAGTSPNRAEGSAAETHRREAVALARRFGMSVSEGPSVAFSWDGHLLRTDTEAFVLVHEVAHFQVASPARRRMIDFGLGAGPDTVDRAAADRAAVLTEIAREREEAMVSLLGVLWEVALGHPALASFLDHNWLEGAGTARAAAHFTGVLQHLRSAAFVGVEGRPTMRLREEPDVPLELFAA
jgi:hypothetical protein